MNTKVHNVYSIVLVCVCQVEFMCVKIYFDMLKADKQINLEVKTSMNFADTSNYVSADQPANSV